MQLRPHRESWHGPPWCKTLWSSPQTCRCSGSHPMPTRILLDLVCVLLLKIFFYRMHAYAHIDNRWHSASFLNHASIERNSTESTCLEAAHCCTKTLQVPLHWDQLQLWLLISIMLDGKMPKKGPDVNKALPAFLMTTLSSWQWNQLVRNGKQTRTSRPAWHVGQFCACTNPTEMRPESRCRMFRETSIVFHRCYQ